MRDPDSDYSETPEPVDHVDAPRSQTFVRYRLEDAVDTVLKSTTDGWFDLDLFLRNIQQKQSQTFSEPEPPRGPISQTVDSLALDATETAVNLPPTCSDHASRSSFIRSRERLPSPRRRSRSPPRHCLVPGSRRSREMTSGLHYSTPEPSRNFSNRTFDPMHSAPEPSRKTSAMFSAPQTTRMPRSKRRSNRPEPIPYEQLKNENAICATCWMNNSPCDHQQPCSSCVAAGATKQCFYIRCPAQSCPIASRCPAYHAPKDATLDGQLASPMHLIALIKLPLNGFPSDTFDHFQKLHNIPTSAQHLFGQVRNRLKEERPIFDTNVIRSYIRSLPPDKFSSHLSEEQLKGRANLIVDLLTQISYPPFKEIWDRHEKRIGKFK
ncbi:hypothetical protein KCU93_g1879, partial [Aureobasidium melanogenum]